VSARPYIIAAGVAAGGLTLYGAYMFVELATGHDNIDALRTPLIVSLAKRGHPTVDVGRALMAIFHNEHGDGDVMELGDTTLSGGPSIGPGQVYRKTAIDLVNRGILGGGWVQAITSRDAYTAFGSDPSNLYALVDGAVAVFLDKLASVGGDIPQAIMAYNGAGDAAAQYEDKALAFEASTFGTDGGSGSTS